MDKGNWRCDMYFGTTRCCLPSGHLGEHTGSNVEAVEAVEAAPSKESLKRARDYLESSDRGIDCEGVALDGDVEELALEFDAIARERDEVTGGGAGGGARLRSPHRLPRKYGTMVDKIRCEREVNHGWDDERQTD